MNFTASQDSLNEIKSALGYPIVCQLDWGSATNDDDYIKKYIISRVMRTYSTYFPKLTDVDYTVSQQFNIPYPTDPTIYKAFKWFFNYKAPVQGAYTNPFFLQTQLLYRGSNTFGNESPMNIAELFSREATAESIANYIKVERITDHQEERKLTGYCNISSILMVRWASYITDFEQIKFQEKETAMELAKAYLMEDAYRQRESLKVVSSKVEINSASFAEQMERMRISAISDWKTRGFAVIAVS